MTVAAKSATISYLEDGVSTVFAVPYRFKAPADLVVERIAAGVAVRLTLGIDYAVTGGETDAGGTLTRTAATNGSMLRITRSTPRTQPMDYTTGDRFPAESHEQALDRGILIDQELDAGQKDLSSRALQVPPGQQLGLLPLDRAGRMIGFGVDPNQPLMLNGGGADPQLRVDLADPANGASLVAVRAEPNAPTQDVMTILRDSVTVHSFRREGETDDTLAITRALATGRAVRMVAGKGSGAGGVYLADRAYLPAGAILFGDGIGQTIIRPTTPDVAAVLRADSMAADATLDDITLRDFTLRGYSDTAGLWEHYHLVNFAGVRRALFERVAFIGMRGDGLYLGGKGTDLSARHNYDVTVRKCLFDGINNQNRQAISPIDIDGALIEDCDFRNVCAPTMPGAIDMEPDADSFAVIRNVTIRKNRFRHIGGNVAVISVYLPGAVVAAPYGITVEDNECVDYIGTGAFFSHSTNRAPSATSTPNNIRLVGNRASGGGQPFALWDGKRIVVTGNSWSDMSSAAVVGFSAGTQKTREILISDDTFIRCGSAGGGTALGISNVDRGTITRCKFDDCGTGTPGAANAIDFFAGASSGVSITNNVFTAPTGKTLIAVQVEGGHVLSPVTNRFEGNDLGGLASSFVPQAPGSRLSRSIALDPPNIANGALWSATTTVTGAAMGDVAQAAFSLSLQGLTLTAWVSAANTVTFQFANATGAAIDLAAGTLLATVVKA